MPRPIVPFVGRLTADPVTTTLGNGNKMTKFTVAINIESGPNKDTANFYEIACFDKLAENVPKFLFKGSLAVVHATMEQTSYTDKDGQPARGMNYTAVQISSIPLAKKQDGDAAGTPPPAGQPEATGLEDDDDIPF
jgi:single-strand DNA-binding protein